MRRAHVIVLGVAFASLLLPSSAIAQTEWRPGKSLNEGRYDFTLTHLELPKDPKEPKKPTETVLAVGGMGNPGVLRSSERLDLNDLSWKPTGTKMNCPRRRHAAALLTTGEVLVVGGTTCDDAGSCSDCIGGTGSPDPKQIDLYNPVTGWAARNPQTDMTSGHDWATATTLASGNVLVTGGQSRLVEIYDFNTQSWSHPYEMKHARIEHTATLLRDLETVLVCGGFDPNDASMTPLSSCELLSEKRLEPTYMPFGLPEPRAGHTATLSTRNTSDVNESPVVFIGGTDVLELQLCSVMVVPWPAMVCVPHDANFSPTHHAAALRGGDHIVIAGGVTGTHPAAEGDVATIWGQAGQWTDRPPMEQPRTQHASVVLDSGSVIFAGGTTLDGAALPSTVLFAPLENGKECRQNFSCASDACWHHTTDSIGICCDKLCIAPCKTCETGTCTRLNSKNCPSTCTGDSACPDGYYCDDTDVCREFCASNTDCLTGKVCGTSRRCEAPILVVPDNVSCAASNAPLGTAGFWALLAISTAVRRRSIRRAIRGKRSSPR